MSNNSEDKNHAKLTLRQRLALEQQIDRKPTAETAKEFGVSAAAIRMRRWRAFKKLSAEQLSNYKRALGPGRRWSPMQLSLARNV